MRIPAIIAAACVAGVASFASAQVSQQAVTVPCGPAEMFFAMSTGERGEVTIATLGASQDWTVYVRVNPDTGTWSVLATDGRMACAIGAGENGVEFGDQKPGEPS